MTLRQCLELVRELRGLERLQAAIGRQPAPSFEWRCGLTAIDDRVRLDRYWLSLEDAGLVQSAVDRLNAEPDSTSAFTTDDWIASWTEPH